MPETVIKIENLWKQYRYGVVSHQYLFKDVQSWWAKIRGREDPNARISSLNPVSVPDSKDTNVNADRFWALKDINLEVKQGELLGIIGSNGAGKSTLLKVLSRVTAPTKGSVKVKGRIGSLLEVGTGFHPELTGRENIFLNGAILGMRKNEIKKKFDEIVAFAEVEKFIDTPVKRYSSGMYVRLAFAVAAHLDPEILVVDEVLAVGDIKFQNKCLGKMGSISKDEGRTVLFVSHNMSAISRLCQSGICLDSGQIEFNGMVENAISRYLRQLKRPAALANNNVKIDVSFTDKYGEPFSSWNYNEILKIHLGIQFKVTVKHPAVHITFRSEDGALVYSYQTEHTENKTNTQKECDIKECTFEFEIQNTGLMCDTISVDIGIAANKDMKLIGVWQSIEIIPISRAKYEKQSIYTPLFYLPTQFDIINSKK
ncbi:MAG: ABC transporter ATP-binding protein [Fibrobacter sp.]|nr:ABC transporter ATP-binding protein [Fibrobacter sp.]